jgi:hypothetical protein
MNTESLADGANTESTESTESTETKEEQTTETNEETKGKESKSLADGAGEGEDKEDGEGKETKTRGKYANKYDTPEDLEKGYKEQTKAVKDLQKQLKEVTEKETLPEDFDIGEALKEVQGIPEGTEINTDDVIFQRMMPAMRDAKVSPEQAKHLAAEFVKMQLEEMPDREKEISELGDSGKATLVQIEKIINGLPEDQADILRSMTTRADEIKTLLSFAEKFNSGEKNIPDNGNTGPLKTAAELESEAFEYKKKHEKTIGFNDDQQAHYNGLMKQAQAAKQAESDAKKKS